jgi:hypothetical protein
MRKTPGYKINIQKSNVFLYAYSKQSENVIKKTIPSQVQWLILVILATWKAKIRRTMVQGQPRQKVNKTPCLNQ